jgi:hypothetical protein
MPIPPVYQSIVDSLVEQTRNRRLTWREGESKWVFLVSLERYSIKLVDSGQDIGTEYNLSLINNEGKEIDSFTVRRLDPGFQGMQSLWESARRNALGLEEALKEIEQELRALGP